VTSVEATIHFVNALSPAQPNPFNPRTTLRFSMAAGAPVTIEIFDVAGRRVRTLVNDTRGAGAYEEVWDGRNDRGYEVGSGLYFARMETGKFSATRKLTLLK
jgi:flagellar hook assembly protein FlgD